MYSQTRLDGDTSGDALYETHKFVMTILFLPEFSSDLPLETKSVPIESPHSALSIGAGFIKSAQF